MNINIISDVLCVLCGLCCTACAGGTALAITSAGVFGMTQPFVVLADDQSLVNKIYKTSGDMVSVGAGLAIATLIPSALTLGMTMAIIAETEEDEKSE